MRDRDIDDILNRAAARRPDVDPSLLDRLAGSVRSGLPPVRPLPPRWQWIVALIATCLGVSLLGAFALGPHGIQKMDALQIVLIFSVLAILIPLSAALAASEMIPGSPRLLAPWKFSVISCIALAAVFSLVFSDFATERFVAQGMKCLTAGLLHALPVVVAGGLLLHRGYGVRPAAAWFAKGLLAGLAGITMLELHCANFELPHILAWHIAVLPLAGFLALAALALRRNPPSLQ